MMDTHFNRLCIALLVSALTLVIDVNAQTNQSGLISAIPGGTAANYFYAKPGDITIIVEVWGFVARPGRYEVASSINLIDLLSLAGGPTEEARIDDVRITRIMKDKPVIQRQAFIVDLEDLSKLNETELALRPGDIVTVHRMAWSMWKEGIGYVLPLLSLTLSVIQLYIILTR